jgi:hypothetical protein
MAVAAARAAARPAPLVEPAVVAVEPERQARLRTYQIPAARVAVRRGVLPIPLRPAARAQVADPPAPVRLMPVMPVVQPSTAEPAVEALPEETRPLVTAEVLSTERAAVVRVAAQTAVTQREPEELVVQAKQLQAAAAVPLERLVPPVQLVMVTALTVLRVHQ